MYNLHPPILALHVVSLFSLFRAENLLTVKLYEIKPNLILFSTPLSVDICIENGAKVVSMSIVHYLWCFVLIIEREGVNVVCSP